MGRLVDFSINAISAGDLIIAELVNPRLGRTLV